MATAPYQTKLREFNRIVAERCARAAHDLLTDTARRSRQTAGTDTVLRVRNVNREGEAVMPSFPSPFCCARPPDERALTGAARSVRVEPFASSGETKQFRPNAPAVNYRVNSPARRASSGLTSPPFCELRPRNRGVSLRFVNPVLIACEDFARHGMTIAVVQCRLNHVSPSGGAHSTTEHSIRQTARRAEKFLHSLDLLGYSDLRRLEFFADSRHPAPMIEARLIVERHRRCLLQIFASAQIDVAVRLLSVVSCELRAGLIPDVELHAEWHRQCADLLGESISPWAIVQ